jgi:hypothetical protein
MTGLLPFTTRRAVAYPAGSVSPISTTLTSSPLGPQQSTIQEALEGLAPYNVVEGLLSSDYINDASLRLSRYRLAWDFYIGNQWENPWEDGELKPVANWTKKVADVAVNWFVANGWNTVCKSGNEYIAELLNAVWEDNDKLELTKRMAQFGAVTGDVFVYVTLKTKDEQGNPLPKKDWKVRLCALNPAHCFPRWNPLRPDELLSMVIQYPVIDPKLGADMKLLSLVITPKTWTLYYDNEQINEQPNPLGVVNVVHIPNFILANSSFGQSDIHQILPLNEEYNRTLNKIRRIIDYHAEPTTVIFGAKVGEMEKGAKKVWSGLPVDAKIMNLELQSDLAATREYLKETKDSIADLSQTPPILFKSTELSISNTSGLAMQMTFQPMIEKTRDRRITYRKGIKRLNYLILRFHELVIGDNISALADYPDSRYESDVVFTSPLPRDEKSELDAAQMKINMHIWSVAEAMRRLSDTTDLTRLVTETIADRRYEIAKAAELQRANLGQAPNLSVAFLDSVALGEDLEALAESMPDAE